MNDDRSIDLLVRDALEAGDEWDDTVLEKIWLAAHGADRARSTRRRIRPRRAALVIALACVGLAGAAVAVGAVGGGDDTPSPTVPIPATGVLDQYALWRTPPLIPLDAPASALRQLAGTGVGLPNVTLDFSNVHRAQPRDDVTPYLIATLQGGVCEVFAHGGGTTFGMSCGDGSDLQDIVKFDEPDGSWRYAAFRPDGVTSVTAADGTIVPVIDNVFVSDQPIR
jgi:hypothetical protein